MEPKQEIIVGSIVFGSVRSDSLREEKASKSSTLPLLKKKKTLLRKERLLAKTYEHLFAVIQKKKQECLSTKENVEEQKEQRQ